MCSLFFVDVMSVTSISFHSYALGSVGMVPGIIAYVFIGTLIGSTLKSHCGAEGHQVDFLQNSTSTGSGKHKSNNVGATKLVLLTLGVAATVSAVVLVSYYARTALNEIIELENSKHDDGLENADDMDWDANSSEDEGESFLSMLEMQKQKKMTRQAGSASEVGSRNGWVQETHGRFSREGDVQSI
jgi:hypothetical protein